MDDKLISRLVDETIKLTNNEDEFSGEDLESYFDQKTNVYNVKSPDTILLKARSTFEIYSLLKKNKMEVSVGFYNSKSSCFRFYIQQKILDFPGNWSIFSHFQKMQLGEANIGLHVNIEKDSTHMIEIFKYAYPEGRDLFLFGSGNTLGFFVLREDQEFLKKKILKIFQQNDLDSDRNNLKIIGQACVA